MSRSDRRARHQIPNKEFPAPSSQGRDAGFTLFEMLISLAILAAILGIAATALRPPSPSLRLAKSVADLAQEAAQARARAVQTALPVDFALPSCDDSPLSTTFFPSGTALPATACLAADGLTRRVRVDALTGQILSDTP